MNLFVEEKFTYNMILIICIYIYIRSYLHFNFNKVIEKINCVTYEKLIVIVLL